MSYVASDLSRAEAAGDAQSADAKRELLSVVCPMYNEGAKIEGNLLKLFSSLDGLNRPWEAILVNDGSNDDGLTKAEALLEKYDNFTIVSYPHNRGRGYALRQGFAKARGDIIVATESDLSWGGDIIERMVYKLENDCLDVVAASPHCKGGQLEHVPFARRFYTKVGNRLLRFLMPVQLSMYTGMTRAYRRDALQALDLESDDKELHLEIIAKLAALGYRIGEVPATLAWEPGRRKRKSGFNARRYILSHLMFGIGEAPLLLLTMVGCLCIGSGMSLGLYLFAVSLSGTAVAGRPLLSFSVLLILAGLFVFLFGFLAEQNKRIERQIHRLQRQLLKRGIDDKDA